MNSFRSASMLWASAFAVLAVACGSSSSSTGTGGTKSSSSTGTGATTTSTTGTGGMTTGTGGMTTGTGGAGSGQCRSQADCTSGDFCGVLVLPPFCNGMCETGIGGGCQTDADCQDAGAGLICDKPCNCSMGGAIPSPRCTKGCATTADCGPSMTCGATHRCQPLACTKASDCTANFTCTGQQCVAKPCTKDTDCGNFCVDGSCSPVIGQCAPAVP